MRNSVRLEGPGEEIPGSASTLQLRNEEARRIARLIRPHLDHYVGLYDERKYPPKNYNSARREFRKPTVAGPGAIENALLWKWGHIGKAAIPHAHRELITHIQGAWAEIAGTMPQSAPAVFDLLEQRIGPGRFITVAFLLHLVRPTEVPIVDQHNFRAVQHLVRQIRPSWTSKRRPTSYSDLETVAIFMTTVLRAWHQSMPVSAPDERTLDKFLMMYGKKLKTM